MDFKNLPLRSTLLASFAAVFIIGMVIMKFSPKAGQFDLDNKETSAPEPVVAASHEQLSPDIDQEDNDLQKELDDERRQQHQTKDLKIKLEQADLELEQEKTLIQINKIKMENRGTLNGLAVDEPNTLPEVKVDYIGGDSVNKEAILSIGGVNYLVKERSNPVANIQVTSISDSGVILHFNTPQEVTKTFDFKPE